jgi:hypothetical protein
MIGATLLFWDSGRPIQNSAFRGIAMRSLTYAPTVLPATLRITSPASQPYVKVW